MIRGEHPEDFGLGEVLRLKRRRKAGYKLLFRARTSQSHDHIPTIEELDWINYDSRLDFLREAAAGQAVYRGPECETFIENEIKLYDFPEARPIGESAETEERDRRYRQKRSIIGAKYRKNHPYKSTKPKGWKRKPKYNERVDVNVKRLLRMGLARDEEEAKAFLEEMRKRYGVV